MSSSIASVNQIPPSVDRWLDIKDLVSAMKIGPTRVKALLSSGAIKSLKFGRSRRVRESALRKFMDSYDGAGHSSENPGSSDV